MYFRGIKNAVRETPFEVICTNCGSHNVDVIAFDFRELGFCCKCCNSRLEVALYNETKYGGFQHE